MIRGVGFDLDNTLYKQDEYYYRVFEAFACKHSLNSNVLIAAYESSKTCSDIFGDVLKKINYYSDTYQQELFTIYQTINIRIALSTDVIDLLNHLKQSNIHTAVVTNGVIAAQRNKVKCLGLENLVDHVIYARQWGKEYEKPDTRPFQELINRLHLKPYQVLFVGDSCNTDIKGAKNTNITAVYMGSENECKSDYHIRNISEVKNIIAKCNTTLG